MQLTIDVRGQRERAVTADARMRGISVPGPVLRAMP
jgi:hypothetical protein